MYCRLVLAAAVVSYLVCVLLLGGLGRGELDAAALRRLQRHHVNVDDFNGTEKHRECLRRIAATSAQKLRDGPTPAPAGGDAGSARPVGDAAANTERNDDNELDKLLGIKHQSKKILNRIALENLIKSIRKNPLNRTTPKNIALDAMQWLTKSITTSNPKVKRNKMDLESEMKLWKLYEDDNQQPASDENTDIMNMFKTTLAPEDLPKPHQKWETLTDLEITDDKLIVLLRQLTLKKLDEQKMLSKKKWIESIQKTLTTTPSTTTTERPTESFTTTTRPALNVKDLIDFFKSYGIEPKSTDTSLKSTTFAPTSPVVQTTITNDNVTSKPIDNSLLTKFNEFEKNVQTNYNKLLSMLTNLTIREDAKNATLMASNHAFEISETSITTSEIPRIEHLTKDITTTEYNPDTIVNIYKFISERPQDFKMKNENENFTPAETTLKNELVNLTISDKGMILLPLTDIINLHTRLKKSSGNLLSSPSNLLPRALMDHIKDSLKEVIMSNNVVVQKNSNDEREMFLRALNNNGGSTTQKNEVSNQNIDIKNATSEIIRQIVGELKKTLAGNAIFEHFKQNPTTTPTTSTPTTTTTRPTSLTTNAPIGSFGNVAELFELYQKMQKMKNASTTTEAAATTTTPKPAPAEPATHAYPDTRPRPYPGPPYPPQLFPEPYTSHQYPVNIAQQNPAAPYQPQQYSRSIAQPNPMAPYPAQPYPDRPGSVAQQNPVQYPNPYQPPTYPMQQNLRVYPQPYASKPPQPPLQPTPAKTYPMQQAPAQTPPKPNQPFYNGNFFSQSFRAPAFPPAPPPPPYQRTAFDYDGKMAPSNFRTSNGDVIHTVKTIQTNAMYILPLGVPLRVKGNVHKMAENQNIVVTRDRPLTRLGERRPSPPPLRVKEAMPAYMADLLPYLNDYARAREASKKQARDYEDPPAASSNLTAAGDRDELDITRAVKDEGDYDVLTKDPPLDAMEQRKQIPLRADAVKYSDKSFSNFLKTQQKINTLLEKILAVSAKKTDTKRRRAPIIRSL